MGRLTTHVLDNAKGKPATGVRVELSVLEGAGWRKLKTVQTNADGRTDEPLLLPDAMVAGQYQLVFHIGEYFRLQEEKLSAPTFL